jgi:hypothetical protein
MISNAGAAQRAARVIYPELPDPLTPDDLHRLFSPSYDERKWAPTVARTPASQVALLVQLKIFQTIGRFRVLVHPGASGRLPDLWPEVLNDEADRA